MSQLAADGADRPPPDPVRPAVPGARGRRALARALGAAVILAAAALAVVFWRVSGVPDDRLVDRAADLHGRDALVDVSGDPPAVAGLRFPSLESRGWVATGARRDPIGDRTATTVFYEDGGGRRLAVTILSGQALPPPPGSRPVRRDGITFARTIEGDRVILSWRRAGRTTIMSSVAAAPAELAVLARAATPDPQRRR